MIEKLTKMILSPFKVNCWIPRPPNLPLHLSQNKKLITIPKLYLQSPKILKPTDSLSYEP
jgi:hypothetical protein